jgi:hypothetical protein
VSSLESESGSTRILFESTLSEFIFLSGYTYAPLGTHKNDEKYVLIYSVRVAVAVIRSSGDLRQSDSTYAHLGHRCLHLRLNQILQVFELCLRGFQFVSSRAILMLLWVLTKCLEV